MGDRVSGWGIESVGGGQNQWVGDRISGWGIESVGGDRVSG